MHRMRCNNTTHQAESKATSEKCAVKSLSKAKLVCKEDVEDIQGEVAMLNLVGGHKHVVGLKVRAERARGVVKGAGRGRRASA
jgi:hypothetical protein